MVRRNAYCAVQHIWRNDAWQRKPRLKPRHSPKLRPRSQRRWPRRSRRSSRKAPRLPSVPALPLFAARSSRRLPPSRLRAAPRGGESPPTPPPPPAKPPRRKTRNIARKPVKKAARATQKRNDTVTNNNFFNGFDAVPAFGPFPSLFAHANERSQELAKKTQKVAGELAELAKANVEAVVEASRVAAEGAKAISQDAVAKQRDNFEQAADAIRSFAEAKSPTEYLQLQSEFARASFDRAVAESSKLTESLVKLAGQAFQPLSNRASANAERFNTLVA